MLRALICIMLISINVFYALGSHNDEGFSENKSVAVASVQVADIMADSGNTNDAEAPGVDHACHLGHCSFTVINYAFVLPKYVSSNNSFYYLKSPSPFLDEDIRPPILA